MEPPLASSRNEGEETAGRRGRSHLLPLRKQQQQNAAVIKEQRWGKDEMHEHIVMRSWKQKPDAITYSYRGMVSGALRTGTGVNQTYSR